MLGNQSKPRGQSRENQPQRVRAVRIAIKSVDGAKKPTRHGQVCGHLRAMREHCRLKHQQQQRKKRWTLAKHPPRGNEDEHRQQEGKRCCKETRLG